MRMDWLRDDIGRAGIKGRGPLIGILETGLDQDRDIEAQPSADLPADLEPVHARHHDVEQDHVDRGRLDDGDRLDPVCGEDDSVKTCGLEDAADQQAQRRNIIDDQDRRRVDRHRLPCLLRRVSHCDQSIWMS